MGQPEDRGGGLVVFLAQRFTLDLVSLLEVLCCPGQRLVKVTLVTGIGLLVRAADIHAGNGDPVTSNPLEQGIGGKGHVAVVTATSG